MDKDTSYKPEEMSSFFDERADEYDEHMEETIKSFDDYYKSVSYPIDRSDGPVKVLDLGCGTGLEIGWIFERVPGAIITCIDLSQNMLDLLAAKYNSRKGQLDIIRDSYVQHPFGTNRYDYVVSVMTMHHFLYEEKKKIYIKIKDCLKNGGKYIEGDYVVAPEKEAQLLKEYESALDSLGSERSGLYHIDIPFSIKTQKTLLKDSGFNNFELVFAEGEHYIYTAY